MSFTVIWSDEAQADLRRLEAHLIEVALAQGEYDMPERAMTVIRRDVRLLETNPHTCRPSGTSAYERELVIRFGKSGYLALFEIASETEVIVGAIRHQREEDYL